MKAEGVNTSLNLAVDYPEIPVLLRNKHGGKTCAELKAKGEASLKPLKNRVRVIEIRGEQRDLHCLRPFFIGVLSV